MAQRCWLGWSMALLCGISGVYAQVPADTNVLAQAAAPATLAEALRVVAQTGETALAVGSDKNRLKEGVSLPSGARVAQIAPAYGLLTRRYGSVTAIAPPTMTLLQAPSGPPNIYLNIPPSEAFTLLAANMSDAQRQMLTGERGIGLSDMNSDLQRGLFLALIPNSSLPYHPDQRLGNDAAGESATLDNPLQNGRLRVGIKQSMTVHSEGRETRYDVESIRDPKGPPFYEAATLDHLYGQDTVDGVTVHSIVANTLKKSQLNYGLPALQVSISLQGVKTVGELVTWIGEKTRLELYADRHYEAKLLSVTGANHSAMASDLLRALAVCVTGTYRRVGPAYVLTDDLAGVAARRAQIREFQSDADAQRLKMLVEAEEKLHQSQTLWKRPLSGFGDPLAPTPAQMAGKERDHLDGSTLSIKQLNFDQLTPTQQNALKHFSEAPSSSPDGSDSRIDFERPIEMNVMPSVQLLVPGLDGPIDTHLGQLVSENFLDRKRWNEHILWRKPRAKPNDTDVSENLPSMSGLVSAIPHRALLADCRTTADVDNTVAKMKRMGLNELWLVVFTNGKARINGTPFPTLAPDAPDLLTYALKITQKAGIALYPVMDVFRWGATMPQNEVDLTVTGETWAQCAQRNHRRRMLKASAYGSDLPAAPSLLLTASVFAPEVIAHLNLLATSLAQRSGVAGIVWRETDPAGYAQPEAGSYIQLGDYGQGYTEPARLAFLRLHHADPIDISEAQNRVGLEERANTRLPLFDPWNSEFDNKLCQEWNRFRAQANRQALSALYASAKPQSGNAQAQNDKPQTQTARQGANAQNSGETTPIVFVRERRATYGTTWYGLWDGLETTLPTHHYNHEESAENGDFKDAPKEFQQARTQSKLNLLRLPFQGALDENALVKQWQKAFKDVALNKQWDGFVLEMLQ